MCLQELLASKNPDQTKRNSYRNRDVGGAGGWGGGGGGRGEGRTDGF